MLKKNEASHKFRITVKSKVIPPADWPVTNHTTTNTQIHHLDIWFRASHYRSPDTAAFLQLQRMKYSSSQLAFADRTNHGLKKPDLPVCQRLCFQNNAQFSAQH